LIRHAFLPPLSEVLVQLVAMLRDGALFSPIGTSLYRAVAGLAISSFLGAVIGLASARISFVRMMNDPLISIGFPLPKLALVPIFTLWFGIYDSSKIALVVFTCVFPIAMAVESAASTIPTVIQWSARSLGASRWDVIRTVILPASMPGLMSGVRVALPLALLATFTAEMVSGGGGIGAALMYAQRLFDTPTVFVYILVMLFLGLGTDKLFLLLRRRFMRWSDEL
jgi:ABC-type nitrate/sulfonate/bicarbonate transport system permease component